MDDCRAQMQHPDLTSVISIKQEQSAYLESHLESGSRCQSNASAEMDQDGLRRSELRKSTIKIKKGPESREKEFNLEFGEMQSSPGQELTNDYQCEVGDRRRREKLPVACLMIKIEQESEESEHDMEIASKMHPSPSHPENPKDTSSPIRRRPQYRCYICSAEYDDVIQLTKHAKTHRRDKNPNVKSLNVAHSKVRKCRSCHKVLFLSPTKKKQNIDSCEKCSNTPTCSGQDDGISEQDVSTNANERLSGTARPPENTKLLGHGVKQATQTFICELCDTIFQSAQSLSKHSAQLHKVKASFNCKVCKKKCRDQPALDLHVKDVHIVPKPFTCHVCNRSFYRKDHLKEHEAVHSGEKSFGCDRCDCKFTYQRALSRHKQRCTVFSQGGETNSTSSNIKSCLYCPDKFRDSSELRKHKKEHHKDRLHMCKICDALFTEKSSLAMHYKAHTGDKPHLCDYCGKGFSRRTHLRVHRRLHTGENPFKCDECGRMFKRKDHLKSHWQNIHVAHGQLRKARNKWASEDCRCVCKVDGCGMRFRHRTQLARHRKTHEQQEKELFVIETFGALKEESGT